MKRTIFSAIFCLALLAGGALFFNEAAKAQTDVITALLELPAPPPPNPLVPSRAGDRPSEFYDPTKPPPDNAPIQDLIDYWTAVGSEYRQRNHRVYPSPAVVSRLIAEGTRDPQVGLELMNAFGDSEEGTRFVKQFYDRQMAAGTLEPHELQRLRSWLTYNTPYFSGDLERRAARVRDTGEYLTDHDELVALGRVDWNRAAPIVNQLYNDPSQPNSKVAALWALYRRALDTDSIGDTDRYRSELIAIVEDRTASPAMRDLALDALTKEKEWPGRDDWYITLLGDETLADLRVNGRSFTGLTTIIYHSPKGRFKDRMIELAASDNRVIRNAAVRNLLLMLPDGDENIVKALLPWLLDAKWASLPAGETGRNQIVNALANHVLPDSVPGLISILDERATPEDSPAYYAAANAMNTAANAIAMAANTLADPSNVSGAWANGSTAAGASRAHFPFRYSAIRALTKQADGRAAPALRRLLIHTESYERTAVVTALLASGGFSISEQVDALEHFVRNSSQMEENLRAAITNELGITVAEDFDMRNLSPEERARFSGIVSKIYQNQQTGNQDLSTQIGTAVAAETEPDDLLIRGVIDRIERLERREPTTATNLRTVLLRWKGVAINSLMLRDLRSGKADIETIVKLLAGRKVIREKQISEVFELRGGNAVAVGTSACLLEDDMSYRAALEGGGESAAAMLACARLMRAELPIDAVASLLQSEDKRLAKAAELYLESEDSPEARRIVLSLYPNQAKVLGATSHFNGSSTNVRFTASLGALFTSVGGSVFSPMGIYAQAQSAKNEPVDLEAIQKELAANNELLGIYSYDKNFIRIRRDGVVYSYVEDAARYTERTLTTNEFDELRQYLAQHNVDELKPFLTCLEACSGKELTMVGRAGGRRVYVEGNPMPEFFAGLDEYFTRLRSEPMALKYAAARDIPGLEVVFADENLIAEAVWKNGDDLRLLTVDQVARARSEREFEAEINKLQAGTDGTEYDREDIPNPPANDEDPEDEIPYYRKIQELRERRSVDGISWRSITGGRATSISGPPPGIDFPPSVDGFPVKASAEAWKAKTHNVEVRGSSEGLFKIAQGKMAKIREGYFQPPLLSSNGRWALAFREDEDTVGLVRVDLLSNRDLPVNLEGESARDPVCYIPAVNRFLLRSSNYDHHYRDHHDEESPAILTRNHDLANTSFILLDPDNGRTQPAPGEIRPIAQQTYRPLQAAGKPHEFWAAIPDPQKKQTVIGLYDSQVFGFKPLLTVPRLVFDSMDLWVDQTDGKAYFVYKGHVLSVPISK